MFWQNRARAGARKHVKETLYFSFFIIYSGTWIVHKCVQYNRFFFVVVIIMKNTQKIQNKRTQVNWSAAQHGHFSHNSCPPISQRSHRKHSENINNCHLPVWLGFPGSASEISSGRKKNSPIESMKIINTATSVPDTLTSPTCLNGPLARNFVIRKYNSANEKNAEHFKFIKIFIRCPESHPQTN